MYCNYWVEKSIFSEKARGKIEQNLRQSWLAGTFYPELDFFIAGQVADVAICINPVDPLVKRFIGNVPLDQHTVVGY